MEFPIALAALLAIGVLIRVLLNRQADTSPEDSDDVASLADLPATDEDLRLPPDDVHDAAAWDGYWETTFSNAQVAAMEQMFAEMFCDDRRLIDAMKAADLRTVLCVGNGTSREPIALMKAGLSVVALDLSTTATKLARSFDVKGKALHRFIDPRQEAPGGHVEFVTGDQLDPEVCPGPFDVVIERRTTQLFGAERTAAMAALARRLADPCALVSHCHSGAWKPSEPLEHPHEAWFSQGDWTVWSGLEPGSDLRGKVAWLQLTTG